MDEKSNLKVPQEETIEELLSAFQPHPSSRFYKMMHSAPWERQQSDDLVLLARKKPIATKLIWGIAGGFVLLLIIGIAFVPPIQVIARQIMYSFISAPSNQIEVQVTATSVEDLYHYSHPENFPLSVGEAQTQAGFVIRELSQVPIGITLAGARFDHTYDAVILLYQGNAINLYLTQRQIGNGEDVFSIGESAIVKNVMVGDIPAELVTGGWKAVSTQSGSGTNIPPDLVNITAIWDNTLPQTTLRWQTEGFAFELRSVGENRPSEDELIALAIELK